METIGSLPDMSNNVTQFEFIVEQLIVLAYEIPPSEYTCVIVGLKSLWHIDIYAYLLISHAINAKL